MEYSKMGFNNCVKMLEEEENGATGLVDKILAKKDCQKNLSHRFKEAPPS